MAITFIKSKLADGIYLVRFKTQYEMASTFLRVQEHYESPRFANRVFSLEQFMDWYASRNRRRRFTYFEDWSGFNVPSTAFQPFYQGKFGPLLEKEKRLLARFRRLRGRFYVIGVAADGEKSTLVHELAHALFFTDEVYRQAVRAAIRAYDTSALRRKIAREGYARHVIEDEVQAYLVAPEDEFGGRSRALKPLRRTLRALFKRHSAGIALPSIKARARGARRGI